MKHPFDIGRTYSPEWIRLDQSENPYGFSFNRYPNPSHEKRLYESYLRYIALDLGKTISLGAKNMLFTRGVADGIDLILRTFALKGSKKITVTDPTFFPILHWAEHYGLTVSTEKLTGSSFNYLQTDTLMEEEDSEIYFLIHPNNPTTTCLDVTILMYIIDHFKGLVVIDEAYIDFCHDKTVIDKVSQHSNLIVLRSLSKAWGCAGLRAGFVIANSYIIGALQKVQAPFMCDIFTCDYLTFLLNQRYSEYCQYRALLLESRDELIAFINGLDSFTTLPSETNFVLIQGNNLEGIECLFKAKTIQYKKIILQEIEYIRISIGTPLEMNLLKHIMTSGSACVSTY